MSKKKILALFMLLSLALSLALPALALEPSPDFYVTDEPGVLSRSTVEHVININGIIEEAYGGQIVIVLIDYFGDMYADEYTVQLFNDWQISGKGMLLAASTQEKRGGITVGSEIQDIFPDSMKNDYLDRYFWNDFDQGNYDEAVTSLADALYGWYQDEFGPVSGGGYGPSYAEEPYHPSILEIILNFILRNIFLIVFLFIFLIVLLADRARYRFYYRGLGVPIPHYHFWYIFGGPHHRHWGPRPPRGPGGPRPPTGGSFRPGVSGCGGRTGGGFGGRSGRGSFRGGGGRSGGGFGGRR